MGDGNGSPCSQHRSAEAPSPLGKRQEEEGGVVDCKLHLLEAVETRETNFVTSQCTLCRFPGETLGLCAELSGINSQTD